MSTISLLEFAVEFVFTARRDSAEAPGVKETLFTNRQSQAIVSMGTSRILRKRAPLDMHDLVSLAIITTPPEAQKYAEMIALNILMGDVTEIFSGQSTIDSKDKSAPEILPPDSSAITAQSLLLQDVLDFLNLNHSTNFDKDIEEFDFSEELEEGIFNKDTKDLSLEERIQLAQLKIAYELLQGRKGIHENHITNKQDLIIQAKKQIIKSIPEISKDILVKSSIMDMGDEIRKFTREDLIKMGSELLDNARSKIDNSNFDNTGKRNLAYYYEMLKLFNYSLLRYDLPKVDYSPSLDSMIKKLEDAIREGSTDLEDILQFPSLFKDSLDREKIEDILQQSFNSKNPLEFLNRTSEADNLMNMNFSNLTFNKFRNEFENLDLRDYLDSPMNNSDWFDQTQTKIEERNKDMDWNERKKLTDDLMNTMKELSSSYLHEKLHNIAQNQVDELVNSSPMKESLEEAVEFSNENKFKKNLQKIREKGQELGMSPLEIAQLIGDLYENLKDMIANEDPSFDLFNRLLKSSNLTSSQFDTLTRMGIKNKATGALGALAQQDLSKVAKQIPNTTEGKEMLGEILGAGGGENLLYEWFKNGKNLPVWMRSIVKDAAKKIMIELAKAKANSLIGSSEAGPLPDGSTKPFMLGDDLDTIDLEDTIENILFLGKQPEHVTIDDFIARKTVTGRRCVIFLIDVSGSMTGAPLASASIAVAMMLYAFARDELGVALFESNTHVICKINDNIDLDEVTDEILDLQARGGTQISRALEWAEKQFIESKSQDKMMIMVTDAMLGDFQRSMSSLRKIADQNVSSVLIVPQTMYGMGNIQDLIETSNAQLIRISDWRAFPEIVSNVLSRT